MKPILTGSRKWFRRECQPTIPYLLRLKDQLPESNLFTFVVGFSGPSVVPRIVMLALLQFLRLAYLYQERVWEALVSSFLDHRLLTHSPVVLIFRDNDKIISRQLIYSVPQSRPWGLLPRCGDPDCSSLPGSFNIVGGRRQGENHPTFKIKCLKCGWPSEYVSRPEWLKELPKKFFFWHHYPLSSTERQYILHETLRIRRLGRAVVGSDASLGQGAVA
jgi:hypothetical protein